MNKLLLFEIKEGFQLSFELKSFFFVESFNSIMTKRELSRHEIRMG